MYVEAYGGWGSEAQVSFHTIKILELVTQKCLLGTTTIILCSGQISVLACDVYYEVFICGCINYCLQV